MPTKKSPVEAEGADFSNFFQKKEKAEEAKRVQKLSPLQELPTTKANKRIKYWVVLLLILSITQFVYYYITQKSKYPSIPEGYQLISSPGEPPYLVKVTK